MTYNNTEDKKYKLEEVMYGTADALANNNDGAASTIVNGTYGTSAAQLGGTALSLGLNESCRNPALDKYGFEF